MSVETLEPDSRFEIPQAKGNEADAGPFGSLPRLEQPQAFLEARLARLDRGGRSLEDLAGLGDLIGPVDSPGRPEILWRLSGIRRPGLVAQFSWPRLSTRLALGIETRVAHAIVDRLLGFERHDAEGRLQLTPVEWGILTFVVARALAGLGERPGPWGPWDMTLDRVGPDPFDARGVGQVVTLRWTVVVGECSGSLRLWLPRSLVARWVAAEPPPLPDLDAAWGGPLGELAGTWTAEAGTIAMPRGLGKLRVGGVLPLVDTRLGGTPQDPRGPVDLVLGSARDGRYLLPAEAFPSAGGGRLTITAPAQRIPKPREAIRVDPAPVPPSPPSPGVAPPDVPVTLVVELGRVNLSLRRLADLKPGDVVELGRHAREPVELTSGGRLVARGELVQIDTELGVRVTNIFL